MKKILIAFLAAAIFTTAQAADLDRGEEAAAYYSDDYATALRKLKPLAEQGNPKAQYYFGYMLKVGKGVHKNESKANKWLRKAAESFRLAAEQGDTKAQSSLGIMYANGDGIKEDRVEAVKWYRRAAEQGDADGQYLLGWAYANASSYDLDEIGDDAKNEAEAVRWLRLAAEQGHAEAQATLGDKYFYGWDTTWVDVEEAIKWYRLAAGQGDVGAQDNLGFIYEYGMGVAKNSAEAAKWYRLAAEQGYANAQYKIGLMYESGEGVTQNYAEAIKWYRLAAEQGNLVAQENLARLFSTNATQGDLNKDLTYDKFKVEGSTLHYNTAWAKREDKRQITYDDVAGFKKILSDNPKINTVHLTSLGGELFAAKEIANLLIDFELHTHVRDICFSACPFILLGGEKRTMERGAKIGFHKSTWNAASIKEHYTENKNANGWRDPFDFSAWLYEATQEEMYDGFKLLIERGVAPDFAIETISADVGDGWYPRRKELLRARVLTE